MDHDAADVRPRRPPTPPRRPGLPAEPVRSSTLTWTSLATPVLAVVLSPSPLLRSVGLMLVAAGAAAAVLVLVRTGGRGRASLGPLTALLLNAAAGVFLVAFALRDLAYVLEEVGL
ncbi:hypothetical protein [Pseudokineococcus sp. 1T1Z-3]|uniref:hypothetical protein n=1 Tax=Pseudokineococcus sp. 1T1Z-3 TaxID=3132745 RepID=UPI0030AC9D04